MKPHTKLYMQALGLRPGEYVASELTGLPCVDVHHIDARGMGGTKEPDRIELLMGLTRNEHTKYGDKDQWMGFLLMKHWDFMEAYGVVYDRKFMAEMIEKYSELVPRR